MLSQGQGVRCTPCDLGLANPKAIASMRKFIKFLTFSPRGVALDTALWRPRQSASPMGPVED